MSLRARASGCDGGAADADADSPSIAALSVLARWFGALSGGGWHLVADSTAASPISLHFSCADDDGDDGDAAAPCVGSHVRAAGSQQGSRPAAMAGVVAAGPPSRELVQLPVLAQLSEARERRAMEADVERPPSPSVVTAAQVSRWRRALAAGPSAPQLPRRQQMACHISASTEYRVVSMDALDGGGAARPPFERVVARYRRTVRWQGVGARLAAMATAAAAIGAGSGEGAGAGGTTVADGDAAEVVARWRRWRDAAVAAGVGEADASPLAWAAVAAHPGLADRMLAAMRADWDGAAATSSEAAPPECGAGGDASGGAAARARTVYEGASEVERALPFVDIDTGDSVELQLCVAAS